MERIRVMVVDDHPIVREGVRSLLSNYSDLDVIGEADNGAKTLERAPILNPDVILLDIHLPGTTGLDILPQLRKVVPDTKVLMLTSFDDDEYVTAALRAEAHGYVLKNVSDETLVSAIRSVYRGERVLSPKVMDRVMRHYVDQPPETSDLESLFNSDERQILGSLASGASNAKIATEMFISETTVKRKLQEIFEKMGVHSRTHAAAEAVRRRLI